MGIAMAIAAVVVAATVASDIGFSVEASQKQDELKTAMSSAKAAIAKANDFYRNVFKVVKTRLEHLKQSMRKLPPSVVHLLSEDITVNLQSDADKLVQSVEKAFGLGTGLVGIVGSVTSLLTRAGISSAEGILGEIGEIAGAAGVAFAVVGFGMSLYSGITELSELDDAIEKVNGKRREAEGTLGKMKESLDGLLARMGLHVGSYESLKGISDDWEGLAKSFDRYSTAFYHAMILFAKGHSQVKIQETLTTKGCPLKDDVLVLAKLLQENIFDMMRKGKTDEEIINYYAKENPNDGLRFLMDPYFVSKLRETHPDKRGISQGIDDAPRPSTS